MYNHSIPPTQPGTTEVPTPRKKRKNNITTEYKHVRHPHRSHQLPYPPRQMRPGDHLSGRTHAIRNGRRRPTQVSRRGRHDADGCAWNLRKPVGTLQETTQEGTPDEKHERTLWRETVGTGSPQNGHGARNDGSQIAEILYSVGDEDSE